MLLHAILGLSPIALAALIGICILGGSAKGALGIGVPLLAVPLSAPFMDLPARHGAADRADLCDQSWPGDRGRRNRRRIAASMADPAGVVAGTVTGVHLLVSIDRAVLNGASASLLVLSRDGFSASRGLRSAARGALGRSADRAVAGIMGGMSGMFGPPLIAYMIGLGLRPNEFVKHISILFPRGGDRIAAGARRRRRDVMGAMSRSRPERWSRFISG